MAGFANVVGALRQTEAELTAQLASVRNAIASLAGGVVGRPAGKRGRGRPAGSGTKKKRRKMSAKARAAISAAQKKRWAAQKAKSGDKK
jgi:hypothetical protein